MTNTWRISDALWALLAGYIAATIVLVALGTVDPTPFQTFGLVLPAQELTTLVLAYQLARRRGAATPMRDLGVGLQSRLAWLVGVGVALAVAATAALTAFTNIEEAPQEIARTAAEATGAAAWLAFVGTVFAAPLVEEFVFRGVMLRGLEHRTNAVAAIVISSIAFSAFHFGGPDTLVVLPPLFILGVILAVVARRHGVGAAIYIHSGFNLLAALTFLV